MNNDEKYYAVGMSVRYAWGGPGPDNIRTGMIVENSEFRRGFYVIKDDRNGYKYNVRVNRILGYNITDTSEDEKEYAKHDEESCKDFLNRIYGKSDFIQPFELGDLVMYKDASKPEVFTVIEIIEYKNPIGQHISYSYRIKRTARDGQDIVNLVDHDKLEKVEKQYRGGYIYPVGVRVRFKFGKKELIGYIQERYQDGRYEIRADEKTYVIKQDSILGYAANWDDPTIRKAFGLDVKNDIYENIKKQINNAVYGLNTDLTMFDEFVNKEDNKMKKEQKKRNRNIIMCNGKYERTIKDISFNSPAVIVKFEPTINDYVLGNTKGDKVVVVCKDGDKYDMKTGFLLAILKEFLNNQSYGNILEKLDSFDAFDIPQVGKYDGFKFKVGDIVRLKTGTKKYKVIGQDTINDIKRYRLLSYNSNSNYTFYERENRLILADEVYRK